MARRRRDPLVRVRAVSLEPPLFPARIPPYPPTIPEMLRHVAARYGDREAQVRGDSRISFRDLDRRSAQLAKGLLAHGAGKGTRIGLLAPNAPEFTLMFMAAARIGAIVAPLSTLYQTPELAWVLRNADIQVLLTFDRHLGHDYLGRLEAAFPELTEQGFGRLALSGAPYLRSVFVWGQCDRTWAAPAEDTLIAFAEGRPELDEALLRAVEDAVSPADGLCMIHTSGSTAYPKGVLHGHGPMVRHTYQMAHDFFGILPGERFVSSRPFFWVAGLSATLLHSLHLGCCIITPESPSGTAIRGLVDRERVTALCGDEGWFKTLNADPAFTQAGLQAFRHTMDCAALARRDGDKAQFLNPARSGAAEPIPSERIARSYGMTETLGAHTSMSPDALLTADRPRFCGHAVPGVRHRIVDPVTRAPLRAGELGELEVSGYCLMQGLYKQERGDTFTADGFYATGDICLVDENGYLAFSHRRGEMLKIRGANVAPLEVELALNGLPMVERSAVVGVDAPDGTTLVAAVQLRAGQAFDEAEARAALRGRLSSFKVPKRLFVLAAEDFPITGSGKVKKAALAERLGARLAAEVAEQHHAKPTEIREDR